MQDLGLLFPHTLNIDEENKKVYFLLYEAYFGRYTVKVIGSKELIEDSFKAYNSSWDLYTLKSRREPILLVATGSMAQQPISSSFLGRAVEEKFHLAVISMRIMPCIPLISENLKDMLHPEIGPLNLSKGVREGYFYVNLSLDQNFSNGPDFFASHAEEEELDDFEREILNKTTRNTSNIRNDEDEIEDNMSNRERPNSNFQGDDDSYSPPDDYMNVRRFSDSSSIESIQPKIPPAPPKKIDKDDIYRQKVMEDLEKQTEYIQMEKDRYNVENYIDLEFENDSNVEINSYINNDNYISDSSSDKTIKQKYTTSTSHRDLPKNIHYSEAEYSGAFHYSDSIGSENNPSTPNYVNSLRNLSLKDRNVSFSGNRKGKQKMDYATTIEDVDNNYDEREQYIMADEAESCSSRRQSIYSDTNSNATATSNNISEFSEESENSSSRKRTSRSFEVEDTLQGKKYKINSTSTASKLPEKVEMRGRGRPKKIQDNTPEKPKRGRGRPTKSTENNSNNGSMLDFLVSLPKNKQ